MNFFKSILSDDPEPTNPQNPNHSDSDSDSPTNQSTNDDVPSSTWSFNTLIQTIATKSESVIETYRKDLQEFSTGLKNETQIVREVANRAVKDLPTSIEAGKSALDGVLKSTAEIISKETLFFASDNEPDTPESNRKNSGRYSWFETQLNLIGNDEATFCEEPEDGEEYRKWRSGFELEEKSDEIEDLIGENGALEGVYIRVVPSVVDDETFWCRYFYRVDKLKVQEKVRANLVKRAIVVDDEEELSWDVDDEDEDETKDKGKNVVGDEGLNAVMEQEGSKKKEVGLDVERGDSSNDVEKSSEKVEEVKAEEVGPLKSDEVVKSEEIASGKSNDSVSLDAKEVKTKEVAPVKSEESVENKSDEKVVEEKGKVDSKSDEGQSKVEEEDDMGWDEIENIGSDDEKKLSATTGSGSPNRAELRKRLSVADDEDEDLSWDIEDDDEPVKT